MESKGGLGVSPREEQSDGSTHGVGAVGDKRVKLSHSMIAFRGLGGSPIYPRGANATLELLMVSRKA